jgi:hypothetical protein
VRSIIDRRSSAPERRNGHTQEDTRESISVRCFDGGRCGRDVAGKEGQGGRAEIGGALRGVSRDPR